MTNPYPPVDAPRGVRALAIRADGTAEVIELPGNVSAFVAAVNALVGGYYEGLGVRGGNWVVYVNEDGKRFRLGFNMQADAILRALGHPLRPGDFLTGTAVFVGRTGPQETDVPEHVLALARAAGVIQ